MAVGDRRATAMVPLTGSNEQKKKKKKNISALVCKCIQYFQTLQGGHKSVPHHSLCCWVMWNSKAVGATNCRIQLLGVLSEGGKYGSFFSPTRPLGRVSLVNRGVSQIGLQYIFFLCVTKCYYPHTLRDSVFPVCGIFLCRLKLKKNKVW